MPMLKRFSCFAILSLVLFCVAAAPSAFAQTKKTSESAGPDAATQELINEVRLLRQELQRSQQRLLRLFSITEHLRAQQELVFQLARQLDETRHQLSELKFDPTQAAQQLADIVG